MYIDGFTNECHKTEIKEITPANHKRHRQQSEPIKLEVLACSSADAKRERTVRVRRDWFRFYFCLDEKVGRDF